jgi:hypothetical protein
MAYDDNILRHCQEIDRCNQRGGRMLSVVDLIEAGTMSTELAAYCLAAVRQGASFMVGAMPGGAGKTTVMGALLNFVPAGVELVPADAQHVISQGAQTPLRRRCFICHEIGPGSYYAYLWGQELREYFSLAQAGHILATNLHADTYEQAHDQICHQNEVPEAALRRMNLMPFLSIHRGGRRQIEHVWESDGLQPHRLAYEADKGGLIEPSGFVPAPKLAAAGQVIEKLLSSGRRAIADVRTLILQSGLP